MKSILLFLALAGTLSGLQAQIIGKVDKKTKEFSIDPNLKIEFRVFGYQVANASTRKMICFSSHQADVHDNYNQCPLGSYFSTENLKPGDRIVYLGSVGTFAKMNFLSHSAKPTVFYLPKANLSL